MIILNKKQSDIVRGDTAEGFALDPVALANGTAFVLPESVLTDPAHAARHAYLSPLPRREILESEWAVAT